MGQVFLPVLRFSPASIIPPMPTFIFVYILLLPLGQTGEAWEPSTKQVDQRETEKSFNFFWL